ncbi:MAG: hypothetical protein EFT35_09310 [Methanophagales archaeon ANME-1-THS]|nr:MAG: hypothetical protein EFT35_09310 [Methanophagales archaeon ANME-1-THS]
MEEELNKRIGLVLLLASLVAASVIPMPIADAITDPIACTVTAVGYSGHLQFSGNRNVSSTSIILYAAITRSESGL